MPTPHSQSSRLVTPHKRELAYRKTAGSSPGVMFLGGFKSDMTGSKAVALEEHCTKTGRAFLRFDYSGHGESSGTFKDGTIGAWKQDALAMFDMQTSGPQIVVGSSMGGWLALLLAIARQERVAGLIGVAAAPDFTEQLINAELNQKQRKELEAKGVVYLPSCYGEEPYPITRELITEARDHLLLNKPVIPVECPVRLLHGMNDEDVPWEFALGINEKLATQDVKVNLIPDGNHRLSEPKHLAILCRTLDKLLLHIEGEAEAASASV